MKKILLIYPPSSLEEEFSELEEVGNYQQPLGLAYLAAVLEKKGHQVNIIDAPPLCFSVNRVLEEIKKINPDIIGISAMTPTFYKAKELAEKIKQISKTPIIIGGPHITAIPREAIQNNCFDIGVVGEGEETMLELVKAYDENRFDNLKNIKVIIFKENGEIVETLPRSFIPDLNRVPFPARHLMPPLSKYHPTPATYKKLPIGTIMTTRGCPFRCTFCCRAVFGNNCRFRSPENVVDELEILFKDFGAKEVRIWDDTFNADPKRAIDICEEIIKRKLNISWTCLARVNFAKQEVLEAMKKAGCWQISYGVESGNEQVLKNIKKGITLEMVREAIKATKKAGIASLGFFILGLPGDTEKTMRQTIDFAKELPLDAANFTICTPFPGTEIYDNILEKNKEFKIEYNKMMVNLPDKLYYVPQGLDEKTVKKYERMAYKEFYMRPQFIIRQFFQTKSFKELVSKTKAFFTIKAIRS